VTDGTITDVVEADDEANLKPEVDADGLIAVPQGYDVRDVEQFLYREARFADESDYDSWEALWTDDALYWMPAGNDDGDDPLQRMSVIYDNRNRISTRLKQLRTGRRYAQAPPSNLRRSLSNIEFLGGRPAPTGETDLEVGANFLLLESRARGNHLWGGRVTYRVRRVEGALRMSYKKVVVVDRDKPIPTVGFLI
jgi:3-phenylpropionate/cinnamic acid dioxygenase small subunit